jgi:predicted P-loop ATPase/GTPase
VFEKIQLVPPLVVLITTPDVEPVIYPVNPSVKKTEYNELDVGDVNGIHCE